MYCWNRSCYQKFDIHEEELIFLRVYLKFTPNKHLIRFIQKYVLDDLNHARNIGNHNVDYFSPKENSITQPHIKFPLCNYMIQISDEADFGVVTIVCMHCEWILNFHFS